MYGLSAAHKELPFGTLVRVTNLDNGLSIDVPINDRGPFAGERILDLSFGAAKRLQMIEAGVVPVEIEVISASERTASRPDAGEFWVQVGAFRSRRHAKELVTELRRIDHDLAVYSSADGWHRVQVRGLGGRRQAERVRERFAHGGVDAIVLER